MMDKPMIMLLLKKAMSESKGESSYSEGPSDSLDNNEGKHAAAKEMIEAIRSSNVGAFKDALASFVSMCMSEYDD